MSEWLSLETNQKSELQNNFSSIHFIGQFLLALMANQIEFLLVRLRIIDARTLFDAHFFITIQNAFFRRG